MAQDHHQNIVAITLAEEDMLPLEDADISYNLNGQKLGRKGRITRERILSACLELFHDEADAPISMSAVARRASLGMTSLYNYFSDLSELILAVLEPVTLAAQEDFVRHLKERWPDEELTERCRAFTERYFEYWRQHSRLLHLRNAMSDALDKRMTINRVNSARPLIHLLAFQMDAPNNTEDSSAYRMATAVMIGLERTATTATDPRLRNLFDDQDLHRPSEDYYFLPQVRLMELAIRDVRQRLKLAS